MLASCESSELHEWLVNYVKEGVLDMGRHMLVLAPHTTRSEEGRNEAAAIVVAVVLKVVIRSDCHFCDGLLLDRGLVCSLELWDKASAVACLGHCRDGRHCLSSSLSRLGHFGLNRGLEVGLFEM
jgi:hypothetical protein